MLSLIVTSVPVFAHSVNRWTEWNQIVFSKKKKDVWMQYDFKYKLKDNAVNVLLVPKDSVLRNSVKIFEGHYTKLGGLQPLFLCTRKKKRAKRARSTRSWGGVCERRKQEKFSTYLCPHPHPAKSSVLCGRPVSSRFCPRVQPSNKNTRK